jgi:ribosome-associated heat shock protein Hsp15
MSDRVRIDKWLWACRFFKTRALAKKDIDGGRVHVGGQKVKPSRELVCGELVSFWRGWDRYTVEVLQLQEQRRSASEVAAWYRETDESIAEREKRAEERRLARDSVQFDDSRPTKKQRRQIHRFKTIEGYRSGSD